MVEVVLQGAGGLDALELQAHDAHPHLHPVQDGLGLADDLVSELRLLVGEQAVHALGRRAGGHHAADYAVDLGLWVAVVQGVLHRVRNLILQGGINVDDILVPCDHIAGVLDLRIGGVSGGGVSGDGHLMHLSHRHLDYLVDHIGECQQQARLLHLLLPGVPHQPSEPQHHRHLVVVDHPDAGAADQRHKDDDQPFAVADGGVDDGNEPLRILHLPSPPSVIAVEHVEWRGVHGDDHHRVLVHRVLQGSQLL